MPNLRTVDARERQGQAYALNVDARAATGEGLLFCDADAKVAPGWLVTMGQAPSEHDLGASGFDINKSNAP